MLSYNYAHSRSNLIIVSSVGLSKTLSRIRNIRSEHTTRWHSLP